MAAVPTLLAGIYGMNFESLPGLDSDLGFPIVAVVMVVAVALLYSSFKRSGWL